MEKTKRLLSLHYGSLTTKETKLKSKIRMKKDILKATVVAISLLSLTACSDNEEINGGTTEPKSYTYDLSLNVGDSKSGNSSQGSTRSLELDGNNNVVSGWKDKDKMFAYNLSDKEQSAESAYSMIDIKSYKGHSAVFTGKIKSVNPVKAGDKFVLFYPGTALENNYTVEQVDPNIFNEVDKKNDIDLKYHVSEKDGKKVNIKRTVSLNMKEQDGLLKTIDKKFDYNWTVATVTKAPKVNNEVELNGDLERKVSLWGMKFRDANGAPITDIYKVRVSGIRSYDVLDMSNGNFVGTDDEKEYTVDASITDKKAIASQGGYVWLAFLADNKETEFTITVYTPNKLYTKTAKRVMNVGTDFRTSITVDAIKPEPYVTVNNVKWATGNFIHYKKGSQEYWGIAPAQWWISNYADAPKVDNSLGSTQINYDPNNLGSQFWYIGTSMGKYTQTNEDFDLFRWGDIAHMMNFSRQLGYAGFNNTDIKGNYYYNRTAPGINYTTDRNKAWYGDFVLYHTGDGKHNYRYAYPSLKELESLTKSKTFIPGFCYTDKGNKVYGAYISDYPYPGAAAKFPTGKKLWKYQDVTGLVLANKGLFLPITGYREDHSATTVYRYVGQGSEFYSVYQCSQATATSTTRGLKFGSQSSAKMGPTQKQAASPIRPVLVDDNVKGKPVDAANFTPFNHIIRPDARLY